MPESETELGIAKLSRPEYLRRIYYLIAAFLALAVISLIPTPTGLPPDGQKALGILAFVTILWVTEAFPLGLTALFGAMLLPVLGIVDPSDSFVGFGSTALFFLVGAISFGIAMQKTNLHKRIALNFIKRFGKNSTLLILSVTFLGGLMSWTMPEHAVAALLLPVLMGIVQAGEIGQDKNFGIAIFLTLTYATSVGSIATLLGGARNVLAIGILRDLAQESISFVDWVIAGAPISIVLMILTFLVLRFVYPWGEVNTEEIKKKMKKEITEIGPMSDEEKRAGIIFAIAFILWVTVGTTIGLATVAIGGLILLIITRTITWRDIEQNMPWGLLFLYGGALTLGRALQETEAVDFLANNLTGFIGRPVLVMIAFLIMVILISNLMSNSAATAVILPIAIQTVREFGYSPMLAAYLIAMGSAMAFMLPIATPSAAMAYSSGYIEIKDLAKAGIILSIICTITFITLGFGWWWLLGHWG